MKITDLTVEVRDINLNRIGQIRHEDLDLRLEESFNNVGTWTLVLAKDHPMAEELQTPGSGIVVTGPDGETLFSGPTVKPVYETSATNPGGTVTIEGVSDDIILVDHLSIPEPSNPSLTSQANSHDVRTGPRESLLHAYVNANIGPSAPAARRKANLEMGTNLARGATVKKSPRFPILGELLNEIANGKFGFRVIQRGDKLKFETFQVVDRSATVRLDARNGQLIGQKVAISAPGVTRVVVAGQNEGTKRTFVYRDTTDSLAAEAAWGRRIERFIDQRQTDDLTELADAGDEALEEGGFSGLAVQAVPTEDSTMRFGVDWFLGDIVGVVVDGTEYQSIVTGMVLQANSDGFRVGTLIGDPTKFDAATEFVKANKEVRNRVSHIEKNIEIGEYVKLEGDTMSGKLTVTPEVQIGTGTESLARLFLSNTSRRVRLWTQNSDSNSYLQVKDSYGLNLKYLQIQADPAEVSQDPTTDLGIATKQYVDTANSSRNISGTDLNDLRGSGFYDGNNLTNAPNNSGYTGYWYVQHQEYSQGGASWRVQTVWSFTDHRFVYTRQLMNGVWSSWFLVSTYTSASTLIPYTNWTTYGGAWATGALSFSGEVVQVGALFKPTTTINVSAGGELQWATMPGGWIPAKSHMCSGIITYSGGTNMPCRINFNNTGTVTLQVGTAGTIATNQWVGVTTSFNIVR